MSQLDIAPDTNDRIGEAILDAADRLFAQFGFKKTTVEEIAQEAGIGKGTIYLHFKSKEELGFAWSCRIHREIRERTMLAVEAQELPVERVRQFLRRRVLLRHEFFHVHRRSMDGGLEFLRARATERKEAFFDRESALLSTLIAEGVASGDFDPALNPERTARVLIRATNGLLPSIFEPNPTDSISVLGSSVDDLAEILIRSIRPQSEAKS